MLGLTVGPFALYTPWLLLTECGIRVNPPFDLLHWVFFAASVILGTYFLWRLPIARAVKPLAVFLYSVFAGCALFFYALLVAGFVFGNWL